MTMRSDEMVNVLLLARSRPDISDAAFRKLCEAIVELAVADGMTRGVQVVASAAVADAAIRKAAE